jgi:5-methylcytosine-specific restriction endonuclease McrA
MNRRTPKPKTWLSPKGNCRFCGKPIIENKKQNKRKNWHRECLSIWFICSDPKIARKYVWDKFKGVCQGCGKSSWTYYDKWEVNHIKPLYEAVNITYWYPENLELLCVDCHKAVSKKQAGERAKKRLQKKKK